MRALDADRVDELVASTARTTSRCTPSSRHAPGSTDALRALKDEGRRLGIVTAKRRVTVDSPSTSCPLEAFFDVVVGADDTERHKPHPDPLLHALDRLGASADEAAYVGDSPFDVARREGRRRASRSPSPGAGSTRRERLAAEQPDALVHDTEELLGVL